MYKNRVGDLRRERVSALKRELETQQNVLRRNPLRASYCVSHLLAKESELLANGEFVRKYL
jgi:hypothetical protein